VNQENLFHRDIEGIFIGIAYFDIILIFTQHRKFFHAFVTADTMVDVHYIIASFQIAETIDGGRIKEYVLFAVGEVFFAKKFLFQDKNLFFFMVDES